MSIERSLRDATQHPVRVPSESLHARIMDSLEGEPQSIREGGLGALALATGGCGLAAVIIVGAVLSRSAAPTGGMPDPDPSVAIDMDRELERVPQGLDRMRAGMTLLFEREAALLRADAEALIDGLRATTPLL